MCPGEFAEPTIFTAFGDLLARRADPACFAGFCNGHGCDSANACKFFDAFESAGKC